jgi:hypothetical protein
MDQLDARLEEQRAEAFRQAIEGPPVDHEPLKPERLWQEHELWCAVWRNFMGALCGYAQVPEGHPWWGLDYRHKVLNPCQPEGDLSLQQAMDDFGAIPVWLAAGEDSDDRLCELGYQVQVHGGITFAGPLQFEGSPWAWWLGCDFGHAGDAIDPEFANPHFRAHNQRMIEEFGDHVWTLDEAAGEVGRLALAIYEAR